MRSLFSAARYLAVTFLLITGLHNMSQAAVMPLFERLSPISDVVSAPTSVALDADGSIYVVESINNRLVTYTQSGQYDSMLTGLQKPISVAVDGSGRIYIGNKDTGNVAVYSSGLTFLFKLGAGDGEFNQPGAIAIDSTGRVYVADNKNDVIKVYNSDGSALFSFGGTGSGDGQFNFPTSIAIDATTGELIIADLRLTTDAYGGQTDGARVQVFDMNGAFKRSFGEPGVGDGKLGKPMGVAVDGESRIYVTDAVQHGVHIFDSNGTFLGVLFDSINPMRTPMGAVIGSSNRLYIASLMTGTIEVYGIDQYTAMGISPSSLVFEGLLSSPPADQTVQISNNGLAVINWSAGTDDSWITVSAASGAVSPSQSSALNIGVNLNGLTSNTYAGSVVISSDAGLTEIVSVELTVLPTPELSVSPAALEYTSTNGSVPSSQTLSIVNAGEGTLNWTALSDSAWITISKASGTAPDSMDVNVDITSKGPGTYSGAITVIGENALSSPLIIPVTLNIIEQRGTINVTTNIADATFIVNGPGSFQGSGTGWGVANAFTGTYSIVFGDVAGYTAPASQTLTLQDGGVITFTGTYTAQTQAAPSQNKNIIVGAGYGSNNTALVKVFKSDGTETGLEFTANSYMYGVNVAAGDIDNDGYDEIITAPGPGSLNPAEINIFDRNGNSLPNLGVTGNAYNYGATVASGDFDGDGYYEVVVGAGAGLSNPSEVKVFVYDSINDRLVDSGINLLAYSTGYGVIVAAGDIDGDGMDELITAPGPGANNDALIRIWEISTLQGVGNWSTEMVKEISGNARYTYSVSIAASDVNGDSYDELITGAGPHRLARDEIKVYDSNGGLISDFHAYIVNNYGASVSGGDLDADGASEIITAAGPGPRNRAIIKIFDANGTEKTRFTAFNTSYGANVAVGYLGLN